MNKNAVKLLSSRSINRIGNVMYDYANSSWIASMGSIGQTYLGLYQLADSITLILFNPIAGVIADRYKRKKILLLTDFICMLLCFGVSFINKDIVMVYALIFTNIILSISSAFSSTANKSFIPSVVQKEGIITFNSNMELILQIISITSPIFSVFIYRVFGLRIALVLNGVSFLLSFLLIFSIKVTENHNEGQDRVTIRNVWNDIIEGLHYIKNERDILFLLVLSSFINLFLACYNYLLPFTNRIYENENMYATFLTTGALGAIMGALISRKVTNTMKNLLLLSMLSGLGISIISLSGFLHIKSIPIIVGNVSFQIFLTIFNIHFLSQIQNKVPNEMLGRVFSSIFTVAILFLPIGTTLMTVLNHTISNTSFFVVGAAVMILSFMGFVFQKIRW